MATVSDQSNDIAALLEHGRAMLGRAEAGEWEAVVKDEKAFRQLLQRFFSNPSNLAAGAELCGGLQQLLQINDRLQQLAMRARDGAKADADTIRKGRKAVSAYAANSR